MSPRAKTRRAAPRRRTARAAPEIAVLVEAPEWRKRVRGVAGLAERAARAAIAAKRVPPRSELCLVLADNARLRRLNRDWRGKDKPTNVLSFPASDPRPRRAGKNLPTPLGDVIVAAGVAASEAKAQGKTLAAHLTHLVVHGVLHLLGYDHEVDDEATRMEKLEIRILARLGVANPYRLVETKRPRAP